MNHRRNILTVMLATTVAASAGAQALTTNQVRAQFDEARRNGELLAPGEIGLKMNEMYPDLYPKRVAAPAKTREQVNAEFAEAARNGELLAAGESGLKMNEQYPDLYPQRVAAPGKTRDQVKAETLAAIRDGEIPRGETGLTLREQFPQRYAGTKNMRPADADVASSPAPAGSSVR